MNNARKTGLLGMAIFGAMGTADCYFNVRYPNETSGFMLTFGLFILGFSFLMALFQFLTGEFPK